MRIEYTGRHTEVNLALRRLTERRLEKLARLLHKVTDVHVILTADKHRRSAEVSVHSPRLTLSARTQADEEIEALTAVLSKLERQVQRRLGRQRERKRRAAGASPGPSRRSERRG